MNAYTALKNKQREELNDFPDIFFAFSQDQLQRGLEKLQVTKGEIVSIGAGGFVKASSLQAFKDMFKRHSDELTAFMQDPKKLQAALVYELRNHEYSYTGDPTDALEALDLKLEEIPSEVLQAALSIASQE